MGQQEQSAGENIIENKIESVWVSRSTSAGESVRMKVEMIVLLKIKL